MEDTNKFEPKVGRLKYSCYVFPQDIQDRMNSGEEIPSGSVEEYLVNERDLPKRDPICYISGHGAMTCDCKRADGTPFTGHGTTDIYSYNDHGTIKYCKTLFESCVVVCQRGT